MQMEVCTTVNNADRLQVSSLGLATLSNCGEILKLYPPTYEGNLVGARANHTGYGNSG